jgi:hypothetical protein
VKDQRVAIRFKAVEAILGCIEIWSFSYITFLDMSEDSCVTKGDVGVVCLFWIRDEHDLKA